MKEIISEDKIIDQSINAVGTPNSTSNDQANKKDILINIRSDVGKISHNNDFSELIHSLLQNPQDIDLLQIFKDNQLLIKQQQSQLQEYKDLIQKLTDQESQTIEEQKKQKELQPLDIIEADLKKQNTQSKKKEKVITGKDDSDVQNCDSTEYDVCKMTVIQKIKHFKKQIKKSNSDKRSIIERGKKFKHLANNQIKNYRDDQKKQGNIASLNKQFNITFTRKSSMKRHVISQHNDIAMEKKLANFYCKICNNKMVKTPKAFEKHSQKCLEELIQEKLDTREISESELKEEDDLNSEEELVYQYGHSVCKGKTFNNN